MGLVMFGIGLVMFGILLKENLRKLNLTQLSPPLFNLPLGGAQNSTQITQ